MLTFTPIVETLKRPCSHNSKTKAAARRVAVTIPPPAQPQQIKLAASFAWLTSTYLTAITSGCGQPQMQNHFDTKPPAHTHTHLLLHMGRVSKSKLPHWMTWNAAAIAATWLYYTQLSIAARTAHKVWRVSKKFGAHSCCVCTALSAASQWPASKPEKCGALDISCSKVVSCCYSSGI